MRELRSIDVDSQGAPVEYDPMKVRKDCRNTTIYCIISLLLFIAAFQLSNPEVMQALPGGPATSMVLGILIIVAVFVLCYIQRPRR
ncbi:hypothetical protein EU527_14635 [Candidatus Thorarchaeota archaeon]|nr:MAG: hypothetical protein EU527_14635 [Candidatus Thorarchaeota archaeon]